MRLTLGSAALSGIPQAIGCCANDLPTIASYVNPAQESLINVGGETGWWGGWQHVAFPLSPCFPYFTLPREFSRVINLDICRFPLRIQNEFVEYLEAGIGLQGRTSNERERDWQRLNNTPGWGNWNHAPCGALQGFERGGNFPVFRDVWHENQYLKVYVTDPRDIGRRILVGPAWDQNGNQIYTQDGNNQVNGFYLSFAQPFAQSTFIVSRFDGIQKDATFGAIIFKQVDATTGIEVTLSRYAPDETIPAYRRYYVNSVPYTPMCPQSPCVIPQPPATGPVPPPRMVTVNALVKLQYTPALLATDFLIIGCMPALTEECRRRRYLGMDAASAPAMASNSHKIAVKMLQDEMRTYLGELQPAVNEAPFGTARLRRPLAAIRFG